MTKKIVLIVCGAIAVLISLPLLVGGTLLLVVGGRSGTLASGFHPVGTSSVALVGDPGKIRSTGNSDVQISGATLRVDGRASGRPIFIGVGPAAAVTDYLDGASYDSVTAVEFSPFRLTVDRVQGSAQPAAPTDQSFWVAQASGSAPRMSWPVTSGSYLIVVMNADAAPGVALDLRVGLSTGVIFDVGLGFTVAGGVLLLVGLALLIWGIVARRRPPAVPPTYIYPPPAYQWPPGPPPPMPAGPWPPPDGPAPPAGGPPAGMAWAGGMPGTPSAVPPYAHPYVDPPVDPLAEPQAEETAQTPPPDVPDGPGGPPDVPHGPGGGPA